ncbi:hypothetical protein EK904_008076 [Melospiza melodia maxima]|nr:hypothetical protein EK904_008076 [Melospiza melodia maxima]
MVVRHFPRAMQAEEGSPPQGLSFLAQGGKGSGVTVLQTKGILCPSSARPRQGADLAAKLRNQIQQRPSPGVLPSCPLHSWIYASAGQQMGLGDCHFLYVRNAVVFLSLSPTPLHTQLLPDHWIFIQTHLCTNSLSALHGIYALTVPRAPAAQWAASAPSKLSQLDMSFTKEFKWMWYVHTGLYFKQAPSHWAQQPNNDEKVRLQTEEGVINSLMAQRTYSIFAAAIRTAATKSPLTHALPVDNWILPPPNWTTGVPDPPLNHLPAQYAGHPRSIKLSHNSCLVLCKTQHEAPRPENLKSAGSNLRNPTVLLVESQITFSLAEFQNHHSVTQMFTLLPSREQHSGWKSHQGRAAALGDDIVYMNGNMKPQPKIDGSILEKDKLFLQGKSKAWPRGWLADDREPKVNHAKSGSFWQGQQPCCSTLCVLSCLHMEPSCLYLQVSRTALLWAHLIHFDEYFDSINQSPPQTLCTKAVRR